MNRNKTISRKKLGEEAYERDRDRIDHVLVPVSTDHEPALFMHPTQCKYLTDDLRDDQDKEPS